MAKTLLLHSCCAPCSSHVLSLLTPDYNIIDYYYNPNITEKAEYEKRTEELRRFISEFPHENPIEFVEGKYEPEVYFEAVKGHEKDPERGERCAICFRLRLYEAAKKAKELNADLFATTLTISPQKDAKLLNLIGEEAAEKYGVEYLPSDFKKKDGYKHSIELSREYNLYRQDYCGCVFSKKDK